MANDKPVPTWRNFAAWGAVGAVFSLLFMWAAILFVHQDPMGAIMRPTRVTAELGLALIFSAVVTGFGNRKRPVALGAVRNFLILNAMAIIAFVFGLRGVRALGLKHPMSASELFAVTVGAILVIVALLGGLLTASTRTALNLVEDEVAAEEMRERGRLFLCSFAWLFAYGLLLIGLSLAGPGGVLPRAAAGAGALALIAVLTLLMIAAWRLHDELGRTLSHETGNMAFYLILVFGGGWALLARLGVAPAPAPLDWLTLLSVLMFAASFIVLGRRKLLTR